MIVELELDLEYDKDNEHYQRWLTQKDLTDTPKNYLVWGIFVEFWAVHVEAKVLKVTLEN